MAASTPLYSVVDKSKKKNRSPVERELEEDSPASATYYANVVEQPATTKNEGPEYSVITSDNIRADMAKQPATTKNDSGYSMITLDSIRADMYQDAEQENTNPSRIAGKPNTEQTNKWVSYKSLACIFPTIIAAIAILICIISIAYFSGEIAKLKTPPASGQLLQQIQQNVSDAMGERDSILHRLNSSETLYQQLVQNISDVMGERDVLQNLATSINKIQATLDNRTNRLNTSIDQLVNCSDTLYQQLVHNVSDAMRKQNNILKRLSSSETLYQQLEQRVSDEMGEQDNAFQNLATSIDEIHSTLDNQTIQLNTSIDQLVNRLNSSETLHEQLVHNISVLENRTELCRCVGRRR